MFNVSMMCEFEDLNQQYYMYDGVWSRFSPFHTASYHDMIIRLLKNYRRTLADCFYLLV